MFFQVSATDRDCGINGMVNYTLGDGFGKQKEFLVKSGTGDICVTSALDYETRNVYEFPVIATDRGRPYFHFRNTWNTLLKSKTYADCTAGYYWNIFMLFKWVNYIFFMWKCYVKCNEFGLKIMLNLLNFISKKNDNLIKVILSISNK